MSSNIEIQRICQYCGNEFTARTTTTMYCTKVCNNRAYKAKLRGVKIEKSSIETFKTKTLNIDEIKAKEFLSVAESCVLMGVSRFTVYRMIERNQLSFAKIGSRTVVSRESINALFSKPEPQPEPIEPKPVEPKTKEPKPKVYKSNECFTIGEIAQAYEINPTTVQNVIKRFNLPKYKRGKFAYVPKELIIQAIGEPKHEITNQNQ